MNESILTGHTSAETAYVVNDYPYGFRLRCKIRYWLEYKPGKGFRLVSQTTNPKVAGEVWNKPKASTYTDFAVMTRDESNGHVSWATCHIYTVDRSVEFFRAYGAGLPSEARASLLRIAQKQIAYERAKHAGQVSMTISSGRFIPGVGAETPTVEKQVLKSDFPLERLAEFEKQLEYHNAVLNAAN